MAQQPVDPELPPPGGAGSPGLATVLLLALLVALLITWLAATGALWAAPVSI